MVQNAVEQKANEFTNYMNAIQGVEAGLRFRI